MTSPPTASFVSAIEGKGYDALVLCRKAEPGKQWVALLHLTAVRFVQDILISTHPAGQSTGRVGVAEQEAVTKAAERAVEQPENAASGGLFHCEADREEAVEIITEALWSSPLAARSAAPEAQGAETFETIAKWCEDTFGPIEPARIVSRAAEEMEERKADPTRVEEAADVAICLARYPGLRETIERKMGVNRKRRWRLMGDGTGYHIKDAAPQSPIGSLAHDAPHHTRCAGRGALRPD
ncbi:hypothetical protein [Methylorubrum extorquens]